MMEHMRVLLMLMLILPLIYQIVLSNVRVVRVMKLHILIYWHLRLRRLLWLLLWLFLLIEKSIKTNEFFSFWFFLLNSIGSLSVLREIIILMVDYMLYRLILISLNWCRCRFHIKIQKADIFFRCNSWFLFLHYHFNWFLNWF